MRTARILSIVLLVLIFALVLYLGWERRGPNQTEAAFPAGGKISFDLSTGGYTLKGAAENKIRIVVDSDETRPVHSEISASGNHATVRVQGPSNNFHATLYVPQHSDLDVDQTIGDLVVEDVEGNKNLALNIGHMQIQVPSVTPLPSFDGSINIGDLRADTWHVEKGGFFRDFNSHSSGPYSIKAHVDIGQLDVRDFGSKKMDSEPHKAGDADKDMSDNDSEDDSE